MATGQYATQGASDNRFDSGTSSAAVSENEDLANFISMITRSETPFMSSIGKTKATGIYHEWQTDELNDPADSTMRQGADFDAVGPDSPSNATTDGGNTITKRYRTRLGNYTQINGKTVSVSGTKRAIDQTGVADEYAYQLKKRGTELRRDVERDLIHSVNTATPGSSSAKGKMGGVYSWINGVDHVVFAHASFYSPNSNVGGQNPHGELAETGTCTVGVDGAAATKGNMSLTHIDDAMQNIYEAGGKANRAMMSPKNRRQLSTLAQSANSNVSRNIDDSGKLRASVDLYMSDFGDVQVEPNYIMGLSNSVSMRNYDHATNTVASIDLKNFMILIYDPQWFKIATLRPLKEVDVGQKGDSTIGMIVEECSLECTNPKGCSAIYGLTGS